MSTKPTWYEKEISGKGRTFRSLSEAERITLLQELCDRSLPILKSGGSIQPLLDEYFPPQLHSAFAEKIDRFFALYKEHTGFAKQFFSRKQS